MRRVVAHLRTPLYGNGYALLLSSGLTSLLGLAYWSLATRLYDAAAVGLNAALLSAMMLASGVAQLSLVSVMNRYLPRAGRAAPRLVLGAYTLTLAAGTLSAMAFALGAARWSPALGFLSTSAAWQAAFVGATMAWCIFTVQDAVLAGLRRPIWVPIENMVFALAKIALLLLLAPLMPGFGVFASWAIPALTVLPPITWLIFARLLPRHAQLSAPEAEQIPPRGLLAYAAGNYLGSLASLAATTLLPLLVVNRLGAEANAYFAQPWLIATSLQLVAGNMGVSLTVEAASDPARLRAYTARALAHTARLLLPLVLLVALAAPYLLLVFGPDYAREGTALLRLLALGALPNMVVMLAVSVARVRDRPAEIIATQLALSALVLGLSVYFVGPYGITGVGLAYCAGQTLVALPLLVRLVRLLRPRQGGSSMLNTLADTLAGPLGALISANLLALLVQREFARAIDSPFARRWGLVVQAAAIPLLIAFAISMAVQLGAAGRDRATVPPAPTAAPAPGPAEARP
jgi:O-antigen/teichoic acid export membrane protein